MLRVPRPQIDTKINGDADTKDKMEALQKDKNELQMNLEQQQTDKNELQMKLENEKEVLEKQLSIKVKELEQNEQQTVTMHEKLEKLVAQDKAIKEFFKNLGNTDDEE